MQIEKREGFHHLIFEDDNEFEIFNYNMLSGLAILSQPYNAKQTRPDGVEATGAIHSLVEYLLVLEQLK